MSELVQVPPTATLLPRARHASRRRRFPREVWPIAAMVAMLPVLAVLIVLLVI